MQTTRTGNWQDHIEPLTRRLLVIAGFTQGVCLYLLIEFLPDQTPYHLLLVIFSMLLAPFWMLLTILEDFRDPRLWFLLGGYGIVLVFVSAHTGGQCADAITYTCGSGPVFSYIITQTLCWCLLSIIFRALLEHRSGLPSYSLLFKYSWHNFFVVVLTGFYVALFWTLLLLGARLFSLVGIEMFQNIIQELWFIFPVSGTAIAYGATVVRQQLTIVTTLYRALHTIIGGLLPMLALISVCFLAVLPFTGLQPLWDTRVSAWLLLSLASLLLFFTNASIQYGDDQHWPRIWRLLILAAIVLLPIYLLLAGQSLWLRIDQYGLTSVRMWGMLVCLILSGYSLCYAFSVALKRGRWATYLGRINTTMLGVIILVLILTNTPVLNVQKIVANNQVERLLSGKSSIWDFDLPYLMNQLGRPGKQALKALANDPRINSVPLSDDLTRAIEDDTPYAWPKNLPARDYITPLPKGLQAPESLYEALNERGTCANSTCYIIQAPIKQDTINFVLLIVNLGSIRGNVYQDVAGRWEIVGSVRHVFSGISLSDDYYAREKADFTAALKDNDIQVVEPEWKEIQIGDTRLRIE